jgi:hypothetical protein
VTPEEAQQIIDSALQAVSINPNTSSTAAVIGTACPQTAPGTRFREDCTPIVVSALSPEEAARQQAGFALATVTNEQATVPLSSSRDSLTSQIQNLATRLSALRAGATGLSIGGLAFNVDGQDGFGMPLAGSSMTSGVATGGAASADGDTIFANERVGIFINGTVTSANKDASRNERDSMPAVGPLPAVLTTDFSTMPSPVSRSAITTAPPTSTTMVAISTPTATA